MKLVFVPHNAYHTRTFLNVCRYLDKEDIIFLNVDRFRGEGVGATLRNTEYTIYPYTVWSINKLKPDAIIVMNDWGDWPAHAVREGKRAGIPTICHVEGAQDYLDTHLIHLRQGPKRNPYQHAEYAFLLGEYDKKFIKHSKAFVTGSPRFDELLKRKGFPLPSEITVGINCNFSYGLYTDIARDWIQGIVSVCKKLNFRYHISQHIADVTDLSGLQVYNGSMYDMITDSTVFVSRFSTGILESLIMGRPVIYHNPHGEMQDTFQDAMGAYPITKNMQELESRLSEICSDPQNWIRRSLAFLSHHVACLDGESSRRFAQKLLEIANSQPERRFKLMPSGIMRYYGKHLLMLVEYSRRNGKKFNRK
jgi:hypothetical protein